MRSLFVRTLGEAKGWHSTWRLPARREGGEGLASKGSLNFSRSGSLSGAREHGGRRRAEGLGSCIGVRKEGDERG